jgi:hypothetical protein
LADWLPFAHPLNPMAGAATKAPAIIKGLTMGAAYPQSQWSNNRALIAP